MSRILYSILGGTGYAAGELLRILRPRKDLELHSVVSSSKAGVPVSEQHSFLAGFFDMAFDLRVKAIEGGIYDKHIVFLSLPHELTMKAIEENRLDLEDPKQIIIDLAGDFRLENPAIHSRFYAKAPLNESLRAKFIYGLPELNRKRLQGARFISCPGCSATACTLAVLPLKDMLKTFRVSFDVKNGSSGAGRKESDITHHPLRNSSVTVYKVLEHRHEPEILQSLGDPFGNRISTMYVPHLLPFSRGIFVTAYIELPEDNELTFYVDAYKRYYSEAPFVRVRSGRPELGDVAGSNFTDLYLYKRNRQLVVVSILDNLMKGAAGQAVQNMNLALGLDEKTGLDFPSLPWN